MTDFTTEPNTCSLASTTSTKRSTSTTTDVCMPSACSPLTRISAPHATFTPPQPPVKQKPPQGQPLVASRAHWGLPALQAVQLGAPAATSVGARTPTGFTPQQVNRTDDEYLFDDGRRQFDGIDRQNLKLRTFKGKDIDAQKHLFDDFAEQFHWSQAEKK